MAAVSLRRPWNARPSVCTSWGRNCPGAAGALWRAWTGEDFRAGGVAAPFAAIN